MAAIKSLKDGYITETGVMSAATSLTTSALILHRVLIKSSTQLKSVLCSSPTTVPTGGAAIGFLGVTPAGGTLTIANPNCPVVLRPIASVVQIPSAASIPNGSAG